MSFSRTTYLFPQKIKKAKPFNFVRRASSCSAASPTNPVSYYLLRYSYAAANEEELKAKRAPLRGAHIAYAAAQKSLVLGGAHTDSGGPMEASLVFRASPDFTRQDVEKFAKSDPYATGGLVSNFTIRDWTVVLDGLSPNAQAK